MESKLDHIFRPSLLIILYMVSNELEQVCAKMQPKELEKRSEAVQMGQRCLSNFYWRNCLNFMLRSEDDLACCFNNTFLFLNFSSLRVMHHLHSNSASGMIHVHKLRLYCASLRCFADLRRRYL